MSTPEILCIGCGHPFRFSDNEAGRCEAPVPPFDGPIDYRCSHICSHLDEPEPPPHVPHLPPLRYCVRCRQPIDPKRVMRGSAFCGTECRKEDAKERRAYRASKACRLCGRPAKHRKPQIVSSAVCDGGTARESVSQQLLDNAEFIPQRSNA